MKPKMVLIGQLNEAQSALSVLAKKNDLPLLGFENLDQALATLTSENIVMAFVDAIETLPTYFTQLNANQLNIPTVAIGPAHPVQNAVKAVRLGAIEYLSTPIDEKIATSLIEKVKPVEEDAESGPIAGDDATLNMLNMAKQFANSNATVLLRGESGTGKEVFSKYIHQCSPRKDKPFVGINCAAVPESLLESELFGHIKGAFSGALTDRKGKFQQADGGTLLLDEISEMDVNLQSKLLRAIQERTIDPIGSSEPVPVDIRLIATTNRDLEKEVEKGTFREDLYFRLNVVCLDIPSLRERTGDIIPLSNFFMQKYGEQNGKTGLSISEDAENTLLSCYWKGNVRELENTIHRAVLMMGEGSIMQPEHIVISAMSQNAASALNEAPAVSPEVIAARRNVAAAGAYSSAGSGFSSGVGAAAPAPADLVGRSISEMEKELILSTLDYYKGNRTHAADVLGISIRTLRNKLKEYNEVLAEETA